ncbi:MAG TPA: hypothetical protein VK571_07830 [Gemmatimonadaceae bacterium]|nr:hypothetical protein [Gemmatimonadaceae bacterium]
MIQFAALTILSILVFAGIPVTFWISRKPLQAEIVLARKRAADLDDLATELTDALKTSNDSRGEFERQAKKAVAEELNQARFAAQDWERRATEYRDSIEGILKERDTWNRLYDEQSIAHGNAQAVMMDSIGYLERKLKDAGIPVILPNVVRETQELYRDRHIEPVLQRTGGNLVAPRPSQGQTMSDQEQK